MERTRVQKSVSLGKLGLDKKAIQEALKVSKGKDVDLASFLCVVTEHKDIPSKLDPTKTNACFTGSFEAVNLLTGEPAMASQGFFPANVEAFIKGLRDGTETVRCGFVIGAETVEKSPVGYGFTLEVFTDKKQSDPFKEFRAALPAPKKSK